ncbi:hypothetical protein CHH83_19560 [Bacillus sp. 7586-K]|nr:hypothetical protein CHH83_19560 [Bacillus sp. 7586-K]
MNSIEEIRNEYENYLKLRRSAYTVMKRTIKPSADYIMDGVLFVNEIVDNIINRLAIYEQTT